MTIFILYAIVAIYTGMFCDYVLFRVMLMDNGFRSEVTDKETKICCIVAGILWPIAIIKLIKLNKELDELNKWR